MCVFTPYRIITSIRGSSAEYGVEEAKLKPFEKLLQTLEGKLMEGQIFWVCIGAIMFQWGGGRGGGTKWHYVAWFILLRNSLIHIHYMYLVLILIWEDHDIVLIVVQIKYFMLRKCISLGLSHKLIHT